MRRGHQKQEGGLPGPGLDTCPGRLLRALLPASHTPLLQRSALSPHLDDGGVVAGSDGPSWGDSRFVLCCFANASVCACVNQCSASCGTGYQQRMVSCSAMPSSQAVPSDSTRCPRPHPPSTRPCLLRECPQLSYWKVGPWSKVRLLPPCGPADQSWTWLCVSLCICVCETVLAGLWGRSDGARGGVCDFQRPTV